jgi:hypothetical protein
MGKPFPFQFINFSLTVDFRQLFTPLLLDAKRFWIHSVSYDLVNWFRVCLVTQPSILLVGLGTFRLHLLLLVTPNVFLLRLPITDRSQPNTVCSRFGNAVGRTGCRLGWCCAFVIP